MVDRAKIKATNDRYRAKHKDRISLKHKLYHLQQRQRRLEDPEYDVLYRERQNEKARRFRRRAAAAAAGRQHGPGICRGHETQELTRHCQTLSSCSAGNKDEEDEKVDQKNKEEKLEEVGTKDIHTSEKSLVIRGAFDFEYGNADQTVKIGQEDRNLPLHHDISNNTLATAHTKPEAAIEPKPEAATAVTRRRGRPSELEMESVELEVGEVRHFWEKALVRNKKDDQPNHIKKCNQCPFIAKTSGILNKHLKTVHYKKKCVKRSYQAKTMEEINQHKQTKHNDERIEYPRSELDNQTSHKANLTQQLKTAHFKICLGHRTLELTLACKKLPDCPGEQ